MQAEINNNCYNQLLLCDGDYYYGWFANYLYLVSDTIFNYELL